MNKLSRAAVFAVFGLMALAWTCGTVSAAPENNNFLNAQLLSGSGGTFVGSNVDATKQVGEPYHFGNLGGASIWYKYVAPASGVLHFATNNSNFDTIVGVYTGTSVNDLTLVATNDNDELDGWMKIYSRLYVGVQAGQTYYIAVDGKNSMDGAGAAEGAVGGNYSFESVVLNDDFDSAPTLATGSGPYSITTTNVGASKEPNEPNHMNNSGGRSVWFNFYNDANYPRNITLTLNSTRAANPAATANGLITVYSGLSLNSLTPVAKPEFVSVGKVRLTFLADAHWTYHIAIDGFDAGAGASTGTFRLTYGVTKDARTADFDEDGKADLSVFRPSDGNWYSRDSGTNAMRAIHWGMIGDQPRISRDEIGSQYYTIFRPSTGVWYELFDYLYHDIFAWGLSGDIALVRNRRSAGGTLDTLPTVFRPSTGTWWFYGSGYTALQFGQANDVPVLADFDGDGTDEITVFRPSDGNWYFFDTVTRQTTTLKFGQAGDVPVVADYTADGIADVAIWRPSTGDWWFLNRQTGAQTPVQFGQWGDKPQPADYDGDGRADLAVFRSGIWWIRNSSDGSVKLVQWGLSNDVPVSAPVKQ
jgi:hypothetical protein